MGTGKKFGLMVLSSRVTIDRVKSMVEANLSGRMEALSMVSGIKA